MELKNLKTFENFNEDCPSCYGLKEVECPECYNEGNNEHCQPCMGSGMIPCNVCNEDLASEDNKIDAQ